MIYNILYFKDLNTKVSCNLFKDNGGAAEFHAILELTNDYSISAAEQFENVNQSIEQLFLQPFLENVSMVLQRWFVSDVVNQAELIQQPDNVAVSIVQQSPLNGSKVAVWIYGIEDIQLTRTSDSSITIKRPGYSHHYHTQLFSNEGDAFQQTTSIFSNYIKSLSQLQCSLEANCIRTWLFIHNIDSQYADIVNARSEIFESENLIAQTHYISSTGIEGKYKYPQVITLMDAYAISGICQEQIVYLKGRSHLNPTHEYGVTFERGTAVQFGDRRHVYISGTASINNKGEIVHPFDIELQTIRVLENINVLLIEANCNMEDIAQLIIYIRDIADYTFVDKYMRDQYPAIPMVIVFAPVCRPGWLVEMECIAIKGIEDSRFENY
jgi:enamine deaminase RidA (YjgF/YER057c/UK114 family)